MRTLLLVWLAALAAARSFAGDAPQDPTLASPYVRWPNGPPHDATFFPIAVWLQNPSQAKRYVDAAFNTYIGLWRGPTEEQLGALREAGMRLVCAQNRVALEHVTDPTIIGWMHGDEPDNAQSLGQGKGYGPPVPAAKIIEHYRRIQATDPSRPVVLNLGQGVAWDRWHGRGVRTNHPEDYAEYVQGCDIASFDIYPVVHDSPEVSGKLWLVPYGVERLRQWAGANRIVWNCIECTRISNPDRKPTPQQVRAEVWMSLIHGSQGLIYFVHEFKPRFNEAALLDDPEMLGAVTAVNRQIASLAAALNSPSLSPGAKVTSDNPEVPLAALTKRQGGAIYVFVVALRDGQTTARVALPVGGVASRVEVLGEDRALPLEGSQFRDSFKAWDVHLYRLGPDRSSNRAP